ncbi:hypothetical protein LCGC14_0439230 [marine sediment metagenome]|uniref:Uncharacterized protein n=1 Tax=marine sediment metagenome TaxID=412755 RepID=A0A0F9SKW8_9ZZZZ
MTKYRNKPCKVCGKIDRSKRKVCLDCKTKYPRRWSEKGNPPFDRLSSFEKEVKEAVNDD